jgi:hypothetical protein
MSQRSGIKIGDINMDKSIESLLVPEENIESEYSVLVSSISGNLVITNKRIILHGSYSWWKLKYKRFFQDIDYKHIISIEYVEPRINFWLLILAVILLTIGIYSFVHLDDIIKIVDIGNIFSYVAVGFYIIAVILLFYGVRSNLLLLIFAIPLLIFVMPLLLFGIYLLVNLSGIDKAIGIGDVIMYIDIYIYVMAIVLIKAAFEKEIILKIFTTSLYPKVNWELTVKSGEEIMLAIRKHLWAK